MYYSYINKYEPFFGCVVCVVGSLYIPLATEYHSVPEYKKLLYF